ncbi:MAG: hypothetical protein DSY80_02515 [Desulfocapsa sp.]|nr:MAG: hypothetical protein DSY80_02515 [Desulfocapsa sp.]
MTMKPQEILSAIIAENEKAQSSLWRMCELSMIAWTANNAGEWGEDGTWANDIADALHTQRSTVYGYKNAFVLRLMFNKVFDEKLVDKAAERGYSFFVDAYRYREDAELSDLLEAIETAGNREELRIYLASRYGDGETDEGFVQSSSKRLRIMYGLLESHRAPENVKSAVFFALEAVESWERVMAGNNGREL